MKVSEVIAILDRYYPPDLAASWDNVGLQVGNTEQDVQKIMVALDPSEVVITEAHKNNVDLLITHHPLVMKGINRFTSETSVGRSLTMLNANHISLFAAHTNADVAQGGVNDVLAKSFGLVDIEPLLPLAALGDQDHSPANQMLKIVVFVPKEFSEKVIEAMAHEGAGQIGNYDRCAYQVAGVGTFRPQPGAEPYLGEVGRIHKTEEDRIEMVMASSRLSAVVQALRNTHPYEEPAFDVISLVDTRGVGLGRKGRLVKPKTLENFAEMVSAVVPKTNHGVRVSGDLSAQVETVGLITGAAANLVTEVAKQNVDVFVTADAKHHVTLDNLMASGPNFVDLSHWASESPWCNDLAARLASEFASVGADIDVGVSNIMGDPWALRLP